MKNLLIATTALVATAGVAAADVSFSGQGRFGIAYDESAVPGVQETKLTNRFTLNIKGVAETDSGIEFYSKIRLRNDNEGNGATRTTNESAAQHGMTVGGLTVAVGNIDGAIDAMPGMFAGTIGLTGLSFSNVVANYSGAGAWQFDGFDSNGGGVNGVEVKYSANGFGVHLSDSGVSNRTAINVTYSFGDWKVGLGHQDSSGAGADMTILTANGSIGTVGLGVSYAAHEGNNDVYRINAGFEVGAGTDLTVYVASGEAAALETAYGIGFKHSLGGAVLVGAVENDRTGTTRADLGVRFNF